MADSHWLVGDYPYVMFLQRGKAEILHYLLGVSVYTVVSLREKSRENCLLTEGYRFVRILGFYGSEFNFSVGVCIRARAAVTDRLHGQTGRLR